MVGFQGQNGDFAGLACQWAYLASQSSWMVLLGRRVALTRPERPEGLGWRFAHAGQLHAPLQDCRDCLAGEVVS